MMTPEMEAARAAFVKSFEKAQSALKDTAEYKAYEQARDQLRKFDDVFSVNGTSTTSTQDTTQTRQAAPTPKSTVTATATVRKGPKGLKKTVPAEKPRKVKAAPKATPKKTTKAGNGRAKATAKTTKKTAKAAKSEKDKTSNANPNAVAGRAAVQRGDRPPLKEAMVQVMGDREMSAKDVVDALAKRNWIPKSKKPNEYIGYMFSQNKDTFENTGTRGVWRVLSSVRRKAAKAMAKTTPQVNGQATPKRSPEDTEAAIAELGISKEGVAENPFA